MTSNERINEIRRTDGLIYAKDQKCCRCGKRASHFQGIADPDCEQRPYCLKCGADVRYEVALALSKSKEAE